MKRGVLPVFLLLAVPLCVGPLSAQGRGTIRGKVKDEQGKSIPEVTVKFEGPRLKGFSLKTNKKGSYFHGGIPYGDIYLLTFEKEGYHTVHEDNVRAGDPGALLGGSIGISQRDRRKGTPGVINVTMKKKVVVPAGTVVTDLAQEVADIHDKGIALHGEGQYKQAIESFREALNKAPEKYYIWANLGRTYLQIKQFDGAIEAYGKAIELKPGNASLYSNLGAAYANSGDMKKARETFEKVATLSTDPEQIARSYYNMGATFINLGNNSQAVEAFQKTIEVNPQHSEAHYQLGIVLLGLNRIQEAVEHLKEYGKISPEGPNAQSAVELVAQLSQ